MKLTLGDTRRAYVYGIRVGETSVKRVMYAGKKIWPDYSDRIRTMTLDMEPLAGTQDELYWRAALSAVEAQSSEACHVRLTAGGRPYNLQSTYGSWALARFGFGTVSFDRDGPYREYLRVGDSVRVELVIPARRSAQLYNDGSSGQATASANEAAGSWMEGQFDPPTDGTAIHGFFSKWQKKVSTGVLIRVWDDAGKELFGLSRQLNGHGRSSQDWVYGTLNYMPGVEAVKMRVVSHQARGPWGAYLLYPAFRRTFSLRVTHLTYNEDDEQGE